MADEQCALPQKLDNLKHLEKLFILKYSIQYFNIFPNFQYFIHIDSNFLFYNMQYY